MENSGPGWVGLGKPGSEHTWGCSDVGVHPPMSQTVHLQRNGMLARAPGLYLINGRSDQSDHLHSSLYQKVHTTDRPISLLQATTIKCCFTLGKGKRQNTHRVSFRVPSTLLKLMWHEFDYPYGYESIPSTYIVLFCMSI